MKRISLYALLLLLGACASEPNPKTEVSVAPSVAATEADSTFLDRKATEIRRLERRLVDLRSLAADPRRKVNGSHAALQALVAQQYDKLGQAKSDYRVLQEAKGGYTEYVARHLVDTLDSMRMVLNLMVAE